MGLAWAGVRGVGVGELAGWAGMVLVALRADAHGPWLLESIRGVSSVGRSAGRSVGWSGRWSLVVGPFLVHVSHPVSVFPKLLV